MQYAVFSIFCGNAPLFGIAGKLLDGSNDSYARHRLSPKLQKPGAAGVRTRE